MQRKVVMGIIAKRFKRRMFGEQTSYVRGLIRIARERKMQAYVFNVNDVDTDNQQVSAWCWTRHGWQRRRRPLPTVMYDRMWGMNERMRIQFERRLIELSQQFNIPFFNPFFGSKYDVHEHLVDDPVLRPHLPDTDLLTFDALQRYTSLHPLLYIKPVRGRQGRGITRLKVDSDRFVVTERSKSGKPRLRKTTSLEHVYQKYDQNNDPEAFIVQQGLDLIQVRGGVVDVRVIVQRDSKGVWQISGVGCRIGARGNFVSNLHAGGRATSLSALSSVLPAFLTVKRLRKEIHTVVRNAAQRMSRSFPNAGEIGIDLGIDRSGKVWILELNRQPGRALFSRARLRRSWRLSRLRVVQYARYLSETSSPS